MNLIQALQDATVHVRQDDTLEERGGFILNKEEEYQFIPVRNANEGQPQAPVLYTADPFEFGKKVCPLFKDKWKSYASIHSHPAFPAKPSSTDYLYLFKGFKRNYILSCKDNELGVYDWINNELEGSIIPWNMNQGARS